MSIKRLWPSLFVSILSACSVNVPNARICTTAGQMAQGADCAYTETDQTEELTLDEWIEFLEPNDQRGGALCMSSEDYAKQKTALEQACHKLGASCTPEVQSRLSEASERIDELTWRAWGEK